jgi:hypothetical protein
VEHAVVEAVARDQPVFVVVRVEREAQLAGEAVLVEDEGLGGEADAGRALELVEVVLDPPVGGAEVVGRRAPPGSRRPWRRA